MLKEDVKVGLEMAINEIKCNNRNRRDTYLINVWINYNTSEIMIFIKRKLGSDIFLERNKKKEC